MLSSVSGTYNSKTGVTTFSYEPSTVTYSYNTKLAGLSSVYMSVTLKKSQKPVITTTSLKDAPLGTEYSYQLSAAGETTIKWSVSGGKLPKGLSLSSAGKISGTPNIMLHSRHQEEQHRILGVSAAVHFLRD